MGSTVFVTFRGLAGVVAVGAEILCADRTDIHRQYELHNPRKSMQGGRRN
jgi:hypothetical protein